MRWAGRLGRWALVGDGVLALVLTGFGLATSVGPWTWPGAEHHVDSWGVVLIVGAAVPLVARRVWPLATLMLTVAATSAYLVGGYPYGMILLSLAVAVYTVAARLPAGRATLGG
ncbi:MAG TPA: sensor histidine kinase, partial [Actinoplanes sp.]|nr:sensor histidine kinase [Actinoplanes sp.]